MNLSPSLSSTTSKRSRQSSKPNYTVLYTAFYITATSHDLGFIFSVWRKYYHHRSLVYFYSLFCWCCCVTLRSAPCCSSRKSTAAGSLADWQIATRKSRNFPNRARSSNLTEVKAAEGLRYPFLGRWGTAAGLEESQSRRVGRRAQKGKPSRRTSGGTLLGPGAVYRSNRHKRRPLNVNRLSSLQTHSNPPLPRLILASFNGRAGFFAGSDNFFACKT